jgi:hypothetical protein
VQSHNLPFILRSKNTLTTRFGSTALFTATRSTRSPNSGMERVGRATWPVQPRGSGRDERERARYNPPKTALDRWVVCVRDNQLRRLQRTFDPFNGNLAFCRGSTSVIGQLKLHYTGQFAKTPLDCPAAFALVTAVFEPRSFAVPDVADCGVSYRSIYHKPLTMHEGFAACHAVVFGYNRTKAGSGERRGDREASVRDETVSRVTNSRYHANPPSDRVFFRHRCNASTLQRFNHSTNHVREAIPRY